MQYNLTMLTIKDIQTVLKISKAAAYKLVHSGVFPALKFGKTIRIPEDTFYNWMRTSSQSSVVNPLIDSSSMLSKLL